MFTDVVTVKPGNQPVSCTVIIYIYCLMVLLFITIMTIFSYKVRDDAKLFNCS